MVLIGMEPKTTFTTAIMTMTTSTNLISAKTPELPHEESEKEK